MRWENSHWCGDGDDEVRWRGDIGVGEVVRSISAPPSMSWNATCDGEVDPPTVAAWAWSSRR